MTESNADHTREREAAPLASRPQLGVADIAVLLWRAKWLMALVFLPIFALGLFAAFQMPEKFTASSRLMATLDDFYVYRPLAGGEAAGVTLEQDQIIQAELEMLRSPIIFDDVLTALSVDTLYPDIAKARDDALAQGADPADIIRREAHERALVAMMDDFGSGAAPQTPIIFTSFEHKQPAMSAEVLNRVIAGYLAYRTQLLADTGDEGFAIQRRSFEAELQRVDTELAEFMDTHNLSNLDAERESLQRVAETVRTDLLSVRAQSSAVAAQLESLGDQLSTTPEQSDIFVEDTSHQRLAELELEREDLLSRYTLQSQPVQAINARIAQMRSFLNRQEELSGTVRRGPNPLHQTLQTSEATLRAQAGSLSEQARELQRQLTSLENRLYLLATIAPEWQNLQRRRALADASVADYATRESQARARTQLAESNADNIRILEPARVPIKGSSLKKPIAMVSFLFAGFTALMAGLAYVFTRRRFATPASFTRTTGLPVLATHHGRNGLESISAAAILRAADRAGPPMGGKAVMLLSPDDGVAALQASLAVAELSASRGNGQTWLLDLDFRGNPAFHHFEAGRGGEASQPARAFDAGLGSAPLYRPAGSRLVATNGGVNPAKLLSLYEIPGRNLYVTRFRTEAVAQGQRLSLARSPEWWRAAREKAATLIVAAPALERVGAALTFSRDVDGVVLVISAARTTLDDLAVLREEVTAHGGKVLGVVMTDIGADARLATRIAA